MTSPSLSDAHRVTGTPADPVSQVEGEREAAGKGEGAARGTEVSPLAGRACGWFRWWAPIAVILVPLGLLATQILASSSSHFSFMADQALIDRSVRAARDGRVLLGPYDRFGWHHPGPTYFYLLAGLSFLLGPGAVADYAGTLMINAAAGIVVIALVRRRVGRTASWWAAALVAALAAGAGPKLLSQPWGPDIVLLPMLAVAVLSADAMAGCALSLLGAALVGSLVVQTEMAAAPLAGLFLLAGTLGVAWCWRGRRKGSAGPSRASGPTGAVVVAGAGRGRRLIGLVGVLALAGMWVPTVIEQVAIPLRGVPARAPRSVLHPGHPQVSMRDGNLVAIWRYLDAGYHHHSLSTGAYVLNENVFFSHYLLASDPVAALVAALVLGGGGLWISRGQPGRLSRPLTLLGLLAIPLGVYAASMIVGTIHVWDLNWAPVIPATMVLGLVSAISSRADAGILARAGLRPVLGMALPAWVLAILASGALTVAVLGGPSLAAQSSKQVSAAWDAVSAHMPGPGHVVELDPGNRRDYGLAAGLADHLAARGLKVAVPPGWRVEFGPAPRGHPLAELRITPPGFSQPLSGMQRLGNFDGYSVYYRSL